MEIESIFDLRERICKGYNSANNYNECTVCINPINNYGETCPCINCLIKMMCNKSCLEFRDYCRH